MKNLPSEITDFKLGDRILFVNGHPWNGEIGTIGEDYDLQWGYMVTRPGGFCYAKAWEMQRLDDE